MQSDLVTEVTEPNQEFTEQNIGFLDRKITAVTPRADARVAQAVVEVAHLQRSAKRSFVFALPRLLSCENTPRSANDPSLRFGKYIPL